jgi:mRNA-degrading endonuclease toxin of MazEF toxin-antitoxin module
MTRRRTPSTTPVSDVRGGCHLSVSVHIGNRKQDSSSASSVQDAVICRVTSARRIGMLDVTLNDWQAAGLLKPSIARLDRLVTAEKTIFLRRLGVLSATDLAAVRDTWNEHMTL